MGSASGGRTFWINSIGNQLNRAKYFNRSKLGRKRNSVRSDKKPSMKSFFGFRNQRMQTKVVQVNWQIKGWKQVEWTNAHREEREKGTNHLQTDGRTERRVRRIKRRDESNLTAIDAWLRKIKDGDSVGWLLSVSVSASERRTRLTNEKEVKIMSNGTGNQAAKRWKKRSHSSNERKWVVRVLKFLRFANFQKESEGE